MKLGAFGQVAAGLVLLGFGLYGAFLAGRAQGPASVTPMAQDELHDLRNRVGMSLDGRFGTPCGRELRELCQIPFVRLIASPQTYQGQRIRVAGLLAMGSAGLALYPT